MVLGGVVLWHDFHIETYTHTTHTPYSHTIDTHTKNTHQKHTPYTQQIKVGAAVVDADGAFVGLILEQLRGQELTDRLADPHFADVDYILECLRQVLTALDVADTALGFRHRDMRMENVMEHRIEVDDEEEEEEEGGEVKKEEEGGRVGHHARGESQCGGGQREDEQQLPPGFGPKVPLEGLQFKVRGVCGCVVVDVVCVRERKRGKCGGAWVGEYTYPPTSKFPHTIPQNTTQNTPPNTPQNTPQTHPRSLTMVMQWFAGRLPKTRMQSARHVFGIGCCPASLCGHGQNTSIGNAVPKGI